MSEIPHVLAQSEHNEKCCVWLNGGWVNKFN